MPVRAQVEPRHLACRRRLCSIGGSKHRAELHANRLDGILGGAQLGKCGHRCLAQLLRLLLDARGRVNRAPTQPALHVVDGRSPETGVRAPQKREQLATTGVAPCVTQELKQRVPDRGRPEPHARLDGVRDIERAEHSLERPAPGVDRRRDERDLLGADTRTDQLEQLLADELERPTRTRAFEEPHGRVELRRRRWRLVEEHALEMRECRVLVLARARRQLLDVAGGERRQVVGCSLQRRERDAARLVRQRDLDIGAPGERLEQRPLGAGQILEAVREDRFAVPRIEVVREPLCGAAAQQVAVEAPEAVELRAVERVELSEIAVEILRVEHPLLELAERLQQRVCEPVRPGGAREAVQRRRLQQAAYDQRPLGVAQRAPVPVLAREPPEEVVERPDRAAEQAAAACEQIALDAVDVRRVRHDQCRFVVEARQVPVEQERDFARVGRPCKEGEPHLPIVGLPPDGQASENGANSG